MMSGFLSRYNASQDLIKNLHLSLRSKYAQLFSVESLNWFLTVCREPQCGCVAFYEGMGEGASVQMQVFIPCTCSCTGWGRGWGGEGDVINLFDTCQQRIAPLPVHLFALAHISPASTLTLTCRPATKKLLKDIFPHGNPNCRHTVNAVRKWNRSTQVFGLQKSLLGIAFISSR